MNRLNYILNEPSKLAEEQFKQIYLSLQNILNWAPTIPSKLVVDKQDSTKYTAGPTPTLAQIPNWVFNFINTQPLNHFIFNSEVSGTGKLAILLDNQIILEIPFSGASVISINKYLTLGLGTHKIEVKWQTSSGTISATNFNVQIVSLTS